MGVGRAQRPPGQGPLALARATATRCAGDVEDHARQAIDTSPERGREQMDTIVSTHINSDVPVVVLPDLLDVHLPTYDVVVTEHVVIEAGAEVVFDVAKHFDFMTTDSTVVTTLMSARSVPSRLLRRSAGAPETLKLASEPGALPGWVLLGEVSGREVAFGAVGTFWKPAIEWHDVTPDQFAAFGDPGWGKIACHLLVRPDGPGRSVLTYECRTATTDLASRAQMARYWWLVRPFVAYVLRAVLRTIRADVATHA